MRNSSNYTPSTQAQAQQRIKSIVNKQADDSLLDGTLGSNDFGLS